MKSAIAFPLKILMCTVHCNMWILCGHNRFLRLIYSLHLYITLYAKIYIWIYSVIYASEVLYDCECNCFLLCIGSHNCYLSINTATALKYMNVCMYFMLLPRCWKVLSIGGKKLLYRIILYLGPTIYVPYRTYDILGLMLTNTVTQFCCIHKA